MTGDEWIYNLQVVVDAEAFFSNYIAPAAPAASDSILHKLAAQTWKAMARMFFSKFLSYNMLLICIQHIHLL